MIEYQYEERNCKNLKNCLHQDISIVRHSFASNNTWRKVLHFVFLIYLRVYFCVREKGRSPRKHMTLNDCRPYVSDSLLCLRPPRMTSLLFPVDVEIHKSDSKGWSDYFCILLYVTM